VKLPRWKSLLPQLDGLRALVNDGGVVCETFGRSGDPLISTLIQVDGDMVTMVDPQQTEVADEHVEQHVRDIAAFFARTERTLRAACYGMAAALATTVVAATAVVAGWWQAGIGLVGGVLAWLGSRLPAAVGRAVPGRWASAMAGATTAAAAALGLPSVAWLFGLGLVIALTVPLGRYLAGLLIRRLLGR
jgi:hypothetical protein